MPPVFIGIDVGASRTKVAILDKNKNLVGYDVRKSGTDFSLAAGSGLEAALRQAGCSEAQIERTVATGYGRRNINLTAATRTEISCHARGCYHYFSRAMTIVDIGGQDNKIIKIDDRGQRESFRMNRKCAAGTGAFLEEMALRLDVPLESLDSLARQARAKVELGSYCTVFTATEVLEKIRQGHKVTDIVRGLFFSVIKRISEMDVLGPTVVMTGGVVAHNQFLLTMMSEFLGREVLCPPYPQYTGAIGAALYALDDSG